MLAALLAGCAGRSVPPAPRSAAAEQTQDPNREVAERLKRHFDDLLAARVLELEFNPESERRLAALKEHWTKARPGSAEALHRRMVYAVELSHAARYEEAIAELTAMRPEVEGDAGRSKRYLGALLDYLAISHLLLGEQIHEREHPSGENFVFPIRGAGVHRDPAHARAAIAVYREMLARDPGDRTARFLMNVAHQLAGDWPHGVPPEWVIAPSRFAADREIPRFPEVARAAGAAVMGHSGGAILEDLDRDGDLDLMVSSEGWYDGVRFLVNRGDGTFDDRTREAGLQGIGYSLNTTGADYDNDGDYDVLVLRGGWSGLSGTGVGNLPASLLANNGDGTFTDVTARAGIASAHPRKSAVFFDYDLDGNLDLFFGNETSPWWLPGVKGGTHPTELYRGRGDGTFEDVSDAVGLRFTAWVTGASAGDYDDDGDPDLYVSTFLSRNRLFENRLEEGRRRFVEVTKQAGVVAPFLGFPTWFFDYDQDGRLDIMAFGFMAYQPWQRWKKRRQDAIEAMSRHFVGEPKRAPASETRLYRNRGDGTFEDVSVAADVQRFLCPMGANYGDLDDDGWPDFMIGTGNPNIWTLEPDRMFLNDRGRRFLDVTASGGFGSLTKGHGIAFGDVDNDGDRDVHVTRGGFYQADIAPNALFANPGNGNAWIVVELEGTKSNRSAIGARLALRIVEEGRPRTVHHTIGTGGSFGCNPLRGEVGLGRAAVVERLDVRWPSGARQEFRDVAVRRFYRLREGGALTPDARVAR